MAIRKPLVLIDGVPRQLPAGDSLPLSAVDGAAADDDPRLSDDRAPTGDAGGVLSGSYPNPGFAVDMATQAELDAAVGALSAAIAGKEPADPAIAKTDESQNFTAPQRSALLTDNDGSFDLAAKQNFSCITAGDLTLTFTNPADGLSGFVVFENTSNHIISAHANTKISTAALARLSATGLYRIDYASDGTRTLCTVSENLT